MMARVWVGISLAAGLLAGRGEAGIAVPIHDLDTLPVPTQNAYPFGIVVQPSGDVWFTENAQDKVGRYRLGQEIQEFPTRSVFAQPGFMTLGADGNVWFVEGGGQIARITPDGVVIEYPLPGRFSTPIDITSGADGNLWFTESPVSRGRQSSLIGRLTLSVVISEFAVDASVVGITRGPDDAVWFTAYGLPPPGPAGLPVAATGGVGRITAGGEITLHPIEGSPLGITTGPDGALWFANSVGGYWIGRMTTAGELTTFSPEFLQPAGAEPAPPVPERITRGPDDNLWFTTYRGGIWRINQAGTIEEIQSFVEGEYAEDIAAGPDGRLWFTQPLANQIGRLDALGYAYLRIAAGGPLALARGADDSIWFVDAVHASIGRIGAAGGLVQYELGEGRSPTAVAVGADGTAWFTNNEDDTIGHITAEGDVIDFKIPSPPSNPQDIVLGPDGNFWFTEYSAGSLGRITPQGVIKRFPIEPENNLAAPRVAIDVSQPQNLAVGPDGNLWFTDPGLNKIGRMTTSGEVVEFSIPTANADPAGIAAGADGNLYFTEANSGRIARVATSGVITELGIPDPDSFPLYITLGPDGAMWWTESYGNRLGRLARDGRITKFDLPQVDQYPAGIVGRSDGRLYIAMLSGAQIAYTYLAASEPTRTATATRTATRTPTPTLTVPPGSTATSTRTIGPTETITLTPSLTATPTVTNTVPPGSTATATSEPIETPTEPRFGCHGDCDSGGDVSINELIAAVNIALGNADYSTCTNADADRSGEVLINDLIAAVNAALQGCPR